MKKMLFWLLVALVTILAGCASPAASDAAEEAASADSRGVIELAKAE